MYDAQLHTLFLGFVFGMIFGHAPSPRCWGGMSATGRTSTVTSDSWTPLCVRVLADLAGLLVLRRWGGMLNGVALLLFLGVTVVALRKGSVENRQTKADHPSQANSGYSGGYLWNIRSFSPTGVTK